MVFNVGERLEEMVPLYYVLGVTGLAALAWGIYRVS